MISPINIQNSEIAARIRDIQLVSYPVEAELIGFDDLPPLRDTVETLLTCGETFYGYMEEDVIVGAMSYSLEDEQLHICRMMVHPEHFRKGIADQLLGHFMKQHPASKKAVTTGALNIPAIRLYQKHGFELVREIEVEPGLSLAWLEALPEQ